MGLNLIMKRRVFSIIQNLAVEYEEKFGKRKGLTPLITNQLLAEALIARDRLPENFLKTEYGAADPFKDGYPYRGFRSEQARQKRSDKQSEDWSKRFSDVVDQWHLHPSQEWRLVWVKRAEKWKDKIPEAQQILDFHNQDKRQS